jgi:hypothetical protein
MSVDDKTLERKLLIKRIFPPSTVYAVGKDLSIPYFDRYVNAWEPDQDEAALELAQFVNDKQLLSALKKHPPRSYAVFRGANYTFEDNALLLKGSNQRIQAGIRETEKKFGKVVAEVLKAMVEAGGSFGKDEYAAIAKLKVNLEAVMARLEQLKVVVPSYVSEDYREWRMLEETLPFIREELGLPTLEHKPVVQTQLPTASGGVKDGQPQKDPDEPPDPLEDERKKIVEMQNELDTYLADLLKNRLQQTIKFGKTFSAGVLADYLQGLFGEMLYADSFLSIIQQYSLCDVEVINDAGKAGLKTGWSYALFGEPGTGKSFSTRDLILGIPGGRMQAHGVPGRNRYCGGITPARFIRIGQLYVGKTYNFIVPEFNDWFRYSGMVDTLKIAMERGEIKQELHREVIGPYRFDGARLCCNYRRPQLCRH